MFYKENAFSYRVIDEFNLTATLKKVDVIYDRSLILFFKINNSTFFFYYFVIPYASARIFFFKN